ncbi:hypothetical protein [Photorhabdus heterorhabditis]|uniref:Uncharacterized protein n=1 Tax=Photorhabdus heterorhabditis TaxID=880156 RepID=A0A5B0X2X5_9GAMM|nr:hypothetical protein [Photorhabdus heterorhabditis]KAA1193633.1 hypothetical protein F0L16_07410 [Photorhabdus heterorhabditis]
MLGPVSNHQYISTKISSSEDSLPRRVDVHSLYGSDNETGGILNNKVEARLNDIIIKNNEMFGFNYYQQNPYERKILLESRKGYCGECSDEVLQYVDDKYYEKVNPSKEHYFVLSKDQIDIIEPSYKQMFFKAEATEMEFDKTNKILKEFPDVFVGSKNDFDYMIIKICDIFGISAPHTLEYWNINRNLR